MIPRLIAGFAILFPQLTFADSWNHHKSSLATRQTKMSGIELEIRALIQEKGHTENPEEVRRITLAMEEKHKSLNTLVTEQREEQLHIRFKHPEKGDESAREYLRYKIKSLNEMESEFGLDARLNRIQEKIRVTYGVKPAESKVSEEAHRQSEKGHARQPASDKKKSGEESIERIVLKK